MKKSTKFSCLTVILFVAFYFIGYVIDNEFKSNEVAKHSCKWELCPYHSISPDQYKAAVIEYTGEEGTDAYCIDMLHLEYPTLEYDALDSMLFLPIAKVN